MYNAALKRKWDNQNVLDYAVKTAVETAVKTAEEEVRKEERAKAQAEKRKSAQLLKRSGVPDKDIAKALGLPLKEVEQL